MEWQEIINFLGGATAISLTIGYLGKKSIEAYLNGRVEAYKNNLEKLTSEHTIRFQRLHTERAEVIKELYGKLANLDDTLHSTLRAFQLDGEPALEEKVSKLSDQFNDIREYFLPRRIFFEENTCTLIDSILESAKDVFIDITTYPVDPAAPACRYDREVLKERLESWDKARTTHKNEIAELKAKLEHEFRSILGINA
ncbi:MAG: hypothetical protein K8H75_16760 [Sulfuricella sp.]|nr:hypothetical protein [Sulfuricella sp.]